jgi:hypothetical protein
MLVGVMLWLRGRSLEQGRTYQVQFQDVDGMREGAAVQMLGIRVGFINVVAPVRAQGRYTVRVHFTVQNEDLRIPPGSRLSIEQSGLIGEKFLEITPPQPHTVVLGVTPAQRGLVKPGLPVQMRFQEGWLTVGQVEQAQVAERPDGLVVPSSVQTLPHAGAAAPTTAHVLPVRWQFRITRPGVKLPANPRYTLFADTDRPASDDVLRPTNAASGTAPPPEAALRIAMSPTQPGAADSTVAYLPAPDPNLRFTIENPLRIKDFLQVQFDSAEALKVTNQKINQLFNDDTIASLNQTVRNTEVLTARASEVMASANRLIQTTTQDMATLVTASDRLVGEVSAVSHNINQLIGSPALKTDVLQTVASVRASSDALAALAHDPAWRQTLLSGKETTQTAQALVSELKQTLEERRMIERLETSLGLMETSLVRLNTVLGKVQTLTVQEDPTVRATLEDARAAAQELRTFSKKLNGRFALFKLLF